MNQEQAERMRKAPGFIAALDQSGGSTPKALRLYGVNEDAYSSEEEMFELVHEMRTRIITSPSFTSEKILAAILFERTMDSEIEGIPTAEFLWSKKGIVPNLKVDKGLADEENGVKLMKPMPQLDELLDRAIKNGMFGTKMRSFIASANEEGIKKVVDQQFEIAMRILGKGLVPIIEPEVDIHASDKKEAEEILRAEIVKHLDDVPEGSQVMFKLTIPSEPNFYAEIINDPRCMRFVALSGGYSRDEANELLAKNDNMIASFSRALTEGLTKDMSDEEFDKALAASIDAIFTASMT